MLEFCETGVTGRLVEVIRVAISFGQSASTASAGRYLIKFADPMVG